MIAPSTVHTVAKVALVAALGAALAGCALFKPQEPMGVAGAEPSRLSIKDDWTPVVMKASNAPAEPVAPAKPATPVRPVAPVKPVPAKPTPPKLKQAIAPPEEHPLGCDTSADCLARLKALVDDPKRAWVGQLLAPMDYADGTRFFAYRALRGKLTCDELAKGVVEIDAAANALGSPALTMSATLVARVRTLAREVGAELRLERANRCAA